MCCLLTLTTEWPKFIHSHSYVIWNIFQDSRSRQNTLLECTYIHHVISDLFTITHGKCNLLTLSSRCSLTLHNSTKSLRISKHCSSFSTLITPLLRLHYLKCSTIRTSRVNSRKPVEVNVTDHVTDVVRRNIDSHTSLPLTQNLIKVLHSLRRRLIYFLQILVKLDDLRGCILTEVIALKPRVIYGVLKFTTLNLRAKA